MLQSEMMIDRSTQSGWIWEYFYFTYASSRALT
jgi:hypothetical protein